METKEDALGRPSSDGNDDGIPDLADRTHRKVPTLAPLDAKRSYGKRLKFGFKILEGDSY